MHPCLYMQQAYYLPLTEILIILSHYFTEFLVKKTTLNLTAASFLTNLHFSPFYSCYHESISLRPSIISSFCISIWGLQNFLFTCSASLPTRRNALVFTFINSGQLSSLPGLFGHPLFQELAPAAHIAVDKFFKEFKNFKGPTQAFLLAVAGLAACAKDACTSPAKQSKYPSLTFCTFHKALCLANADATASPTSPHSEKMKKQGNLVHVSNKLCLMYFN